MEALNWIKQLVENGEWRRALAELSAILRAQPGDVEAWWLLASLVNDADKKADCYLQILSIDPDHTDAKRQLNALLLDPDVDVGEYPSEFQENLDYMRLQQDLAPPPPKETPPWLRALNQTILNPDPLEGMKFRLYDTDDRRRLGPLRPEDAFDLLEPLPEEEQTRCPDCQAKISLNAPKCQWCGASLSSA